MDSPSLIDQLHAFEEGVSSINAIRYCALAAALIIFWDHVSTFDREVEFLRFRRWSIGKALFIANRYYTLAAAIFNNYGLFNPTVSNAFCNHLFRWQAATGIISVLISQTTLLLRLYALYDLDKRVLALMCILFVGTLGSAATIHILAFSKIRASSHDLPGLPFCVPHGLPSTYWVVWVPILAFETFLLALAIRKAMLQDRFDNPQSHGSRRTRSRKDRIRDPWAKTQRFATLIGRAERLVDVLIRDSVLYFFVMFAAYLVNLLVWLLGTVNTIDLPIAFSEAFSCIMCSHMLLNVHELSRQGAPATDNSSHPVFRGQSIALRETSYGVEVSVYVESGIA